MSIAYDIYLQEHKENVSKGFRWLKNNLPQLFDSKVNDIDLEHLICFSHDASKSLAEEYNAYDAYFYGGNRSYEVVENFRYAWLHHIHHNPHHWQHWILINDEPDEGEIILDIPYNYVIEMICDWWAFSWKKGDLTEIFKWYDDHKDYMKLSDRTRRTVDDILQKMRMIIEPEPFRTE